MNVKRIIRFFLDFAIVWLSISVVLYLPCYFWFKSNTPDDLRAIYLIDLFVLNLLISTVVFLIGGLLSIINRFCASLWMWIFFIFSLFVSFGETFMIKFFQTRYAPFIFQLIDETNQTETSDFVVAYCLSIKFFVIFFFYVVILGLGTVFLYRMSQKKVYFGEIIRYVALLPILLVIPTVSYHVLGISLTNSSSQQQMYFPAHDGCIRSFIMSCMLFNAQKKECLQSNEVHKNVVVDSCSYQTPTLVLIIGESFNRHHSSLYGYYLPTNPRVGELDSLFIFTDVITSVNGTSQSFHNFMSLTSVDQSKSWAESPTFMAFFKSAGYYVTFYSNQYPKKFHTDSEDMSGAYFLDMPNVASSCFDLRNRETYEYDKQLVDSFEIARRNTSGKKLKLDIVHFIGQHMRTEERYPKEYSYFSSDSIKKNGLTLQQREEVAYYDNATRYNDALIRRVIDMYCDEEAIFVIFADHGDEAHDFRYHRGRSFDISEGAPMMHNQMDIPFIIYANKKYREKHPQLINRVASSVNRPYMIDDLPHTLLDIAGISTSFFDPTRSVINDKFNQKRKRMVGFDVKYDYDAICK